MVLICESNSCRQRLNSPVKVGQASSDFNEDTDMNLPSNKEHVNTEEEFDEMQRLLPAILSTLFEHGKLESYLKFNRLINEKKLPVDNICFLLFDDLVEWYSSSNTSKMRYQKRNNAVLATRLSPSK